MSGSTPRDVGFCSWTDVPRGDLDIPGLPGLCKLAVPPGILGVGGGAILLFGM
jgi:hypothetical protein